MQLYNGVLALFFAVSLVACERETIPDSASAVSEGSAPASADTREHYNVVLFYVDDLGYGDLSSYGATEISTPNVDKLAAGGIRFTDAHSPAATCTPSRAAMLTGRYAFRDKAVILPGDAPLVIDPDRPSLADLFKRAGYRTAVVGKWHLGLGRGAVDWNAAVQPGPLELGFDYSFLMPATGDRVPTAYLENHHIVGLEADDPLTVSYSGEKIGDRPVGREQPELLKQLADDQHSDSVINGISRIGYMAGGKNTEWVDEDFPHVFTDKAIDFIKSAQDQPFFLYFPFHDIHVPRVPNAMFAGKSGMGPRGDAILQMDWMTGRIVDTLKALGLMKKTLIIFSSDNGPVLDDGYADQSVELIGKHTPRGPFNGGKYSAYEAGTRVPMITYLEGRIQPGVSDALFSHVDFYASFAVMLNLELEEGEASDSQAILPALFSADESAREFMLEEAFTLALRHRQWKYIAPFTGSTPDWLANKTAIDAGLRDFPQLFDLSQDIGESQNLAASQPERVAAMQAKLEQIIAAEHRP